MLPGLASWVIGPFSRAGIAEPILAPNPDAVFECPVRKGPVHWMSDHVFNTAAVVRGGRIYLLFRAEDDSGQGIGQHTSRIGIAVSEDGVHFKVDPKPVLYPDEDWFKQFEWPGGCEDPRVVQTPDGGYLMTYTAWNRLNATLCTAYSNDLYHWAKRGPAFTSRFHMWSKSGAVVSQMVDGEPQAVKIGGKYWMYWGDLDLHIAFSQNLITWQVLVDSKGTFINVMSPRPKHFDSALVESGPPAMLTKDGIVLIYNGKNADDPGLKLDVYCAGQALFDAKQPEKLIDRTEGYFMKPELGHETTGQYTAGDIFTEGLVQFKGAWWLYFGAADSYVGAVKSK